MNSCPGMNTKHALWKHDSMWSLHKHNNKMAVLFCCFSLEFEPSRHQINTESYRKLPVPEIALFYIKKISEKVFECAPEFFHGWRICTVAKKVHPICTRDASSPSPLYNRNQRAMNSSWPVAMRNQSRKPCSVDALCHGLAAIGRPLPWAVRPPMWHITGAVCFPPLFPTRMVAVRGFISRFWNLRSCGRCGVCPFVCILGHIRARLND